MTNIFLKDYVTCHDILNGDYKYVALEITLLCLIIHAT